jgi:oxygen-independent coproporphyrinogen-3 oxidase
MLDRGQLPLGRALPVTHRQLLIREMILQLKTGRLDVRYFKGKFGMDIRAEFAEEFGELERGGWLTVWEDEVRLTPEGLLQVDRLLPTFFEPEHRVSRYT